MTAKRVYGQIHYSQSHNQSVSLTHSWLASRLHLSRQAIGRAVWQLNDSRLLHIHAVRDTGSIFSIIKEKSPKKFFLFLYDSNNSGHNESEKLLIAYLKWRQGENKTAWPFLKTIAADLGYSKATVCRLLASLEKSGMVEIIHANGGKRQKNRYSVTPKAFFVPVCDTKPESGVSNHNTFNKHYKDFKKNHNPESSSGNEIIKKRQLLSDHGVAYPVASALTKQHSLANVENAVINAVCQEQLRRPGVKFNRAAYIVGILNKAAEQGKNVELNLFAREAQKKYALQSARIGDRTKLQAVDTAKKSQILADLENRKAQLAAGTARRNVPESLRRFLGVA